MKIMSFILAICLFANSTGFAYYIMDPDLGSYSRGPRDRRLILDQETRKTGDKPFVGPYVEVGGPY